jgi:CO/xanthine dehydrogenase FAD-binding subunit
MQSFDYHKAYSLQEALDAASSREALAFLAGGTDLLVQIKQGKRLPQHVIDVKGIREIDGMAISENACSIGALTTIRALETDPAVAEKAPLLAQAAAKLGSVQVRHRATVGGNLCNASPSADMAPALLALDAQAIIFGRQGQRNIELVDFFLGPGVTGLKDGELLARLEIPLTRMRCGSVYYKVSTRNAMDLAFVGVAVLIEVDERDRIVKARVALGAVAPTPIRVPSAEKGLEGRVLSLDVVRESAALAAKSCNPISDLRASAEYRREMVRALCERGLLSAYRQAISMVGGKSR